MLILGKTLETIFVFKVSVCTFASIMEIKILEKSADLFLTYGFKSITMDDIANSLGMSKKQFINITITSTN